MDDIHRLRTIAWYHAVADEVGGKTPYEVTNLVDEIRATQSDQSNGEAKSFFPYAKGKVVPSEETLEMVESLLPWTRQVFDMGPKIERGNAPIWLALGGSEQAIRSVLVWYQPKELGHLQASGASVYNLIQHVTGKWFPEPLVLEALDQGEPNWVEVAYSEGLLELSMELLTALICLWRLSMYMRQDFPYMNYLVTGLFRKAIPELMKPYGLELDFVDYCKCIENHYWRYLRKLSEGQLFDTDSPCL